MPKFKTNFWLVTATAGAVVGVLQAGVDALLVAWHPQDAQMLLSWAAVEIVAALGLALCADVELAQRGELVELVVVKAQETIDLRS